MLWQRRSARPVSLTSRLSYPSPRSSGCALVSPLALSLTAPCGDASTSLAAGARCTQVVFEEMEQLQRIVGIADAWSRGAQALLGQAMEAGACTRFPG
jgi:hypothetical protein